MSQNQNGISSPFSSQNSSRKIRLNCLPGAAQRDVLLHAHRLHAELGRLDGAHVAARPRTDDHEVHIVAGRVEAER